MVGYSNAADTACTFNSGAVDISQNCSFPFTYNGGLYYQCVATNYSDCNQRPRCLLASSNTMTFCSNQMNGFVAENVTLNVTIPSVASPVPLMSVNNWITILSRVDSTFPTGFGASSQLYTIGFGDILTNYWLGLDKIYKLTNTAINGGKTYRLRFEVLSAADSKWRSRVYDWFYLDSSPSYIFRSSSTSTGDAADAIHANSPTNNQAWTSLTNGTCSVSNCGPWWYPSASSCGYSRMLGPINNGGKGFIWGNQLSWSPLQAARMMIKQVV